MKKHFEKSFLAIILVLSLLLVIAGGASVKIDGTELFGSNGVLAVLYESVILLNFDFELSDADVGEVLRENEFGTVAKLSGDYCLFLRANGDAVIFSIPQGSLVLIEVTEASEFLPEVAEFLSKNRVFSGFGDAFKVNRRAVALRYGDKYSVFDFAYKDVRYYNSEAEIYVDYNLDSIDWTER